MAKLVRPRWFWLGLAVCVFVLIGLAAYTVAVGLDKANKVAGVAALGVAVLAPAAPYLFAMRGTKKDSVPAIEVIDSGETKATHGGHANAGVETTATDGPLRIEGSGPAIAEGPESVANSGIVQTPRQDR